MALIQVRVDQRLKEEASDIFKELGLDLSTAIRAFLKRVVAEGEVPFNLKLSDKALAGVKTIREMQQISLENGNCNMTLDEINEEIAAARRERRERENKKKSS